MLIATLLFAQASAAQAAGRVAPDAVAPASIVAAAPVADWVAIAPSDLIVMDLAPAPRGPRRVVIQLMPAPFSQGWIGNIRTLVAARWYDGVSVNRVQDNYVVQWGDANAEDKAKAKKLPGGLVQLPSTSFVFPIDWRVVRLFRDKQRLVTRVRATSPARINETRPINMQDPYASLSAHLAGFPVATDEAGMWPVHCYGMVGVGRDLPPDTGNGAELYTVIGHAPRHLDRNIAVVGRVIAGIEHLSSLPRGTGALGFYEKAEERVPIVSVRMGNEVAGLPRYQYLSTESASFTRYADARANRRDAFFIQPAGGADICNIPVPVRVAPAP